MRVRDKNEVAQAINTCLSHTAILIGLRDTEVEGTMILQNVRNFLSSDHDTFQETCVFSTIALRTLNLTSTRSYILAYCPHFQWNNRHVHLEDDLGGVCQTLWVNKVVMSSQGSFCK